eukprot:TRINITY_DN1633_c0_g1_i2.p1 TRINITY_DN1633_c0_g1~~TRINITY_DN1633_c0_g1_i2.p1  ORF type:complete len:402 (-),score=100.87 TRINITY_DN1633_c0_g1_i2:82-1287(-)
MQRTLLLLCIVLAVTLVNAQITINGRNFLVNGQKLTWRGVAYGMTPLGQWPDSKDAAAAWDWVTSPSLFDRDLQNLQEMNANLIRVYNIRYNVRHDAFLDACAKAGVYVILSYQWKWDQFSANNLAAMRTDVTNLVLNHANHSAVLGWCVGNELNLNRAFDVNVWNFVKELKDLVHSTESRIGAPWHPVTSPFADGSSLWNLVANYSSSFDFFTAQLYKGDSFWDFFTLTKRHAQKPMLITEFGADSYVEGKSTSQGETDQAVWNSKLWTEINNNLDAVMGGVIFQYADGWYKCAGDGLARHDLCPVNANMPGGQTNEEYFGIFAFVNTVKTSDGNDTLRAKATYFSLKNQWANYTRTVPYTPTFTRGSSSNRDTLQENGVQKMIAAPLFTLFIMCLYRLL